MKNIRVSFQHTNGRVEGIYINAGRAVKKGVGKVGDKLEGVLDNDKKGKNKDR
jgi:hypothetical protein